MNEKVIERTARFWESFEVELKAAIDKHVARLGRGVVADWLGRHETELFAGLTRSTQERQRPLLDRAMFWKSVEQLRARGYAPTDGELLKGMLDTLSVSDN